MLRTYKTNRRRTGGRRNRKTVVQEPSTEDDDDDNNESSSAAEEEAEEYVDSDDGSENDENEKDDNTEEHVDDSPPRRLTRSGARDSGTTNTTTARKMKDTLQKRRRSSKRRQPDRRAVATSQDRSDEKDGDDDDDDDATSVDGGDNSKENDDDDATAAVRSTRSSSKSENKKKYDRLSYSTRTRTRSQRSSQTKGDVGGDVLATLPSPRSGAAKAKTKLTKTTKGRIKSNGDGDDDDNDENEDNNNNGNHDTDKTPSDESSSYRDDDDDDDKESDYSEAEDKEIDKLLQKRSSKNRNSVRKKTGFTSATTKKITRRKKAAHSSDEEFVVDSDDDDDESNDSFGDNDDYDDYIDAQLSEGDNDITMIGDADLSDEDDKHKKGKKQADVNAVNIDHDQISTIDDDDKLKKRLSKSTTTKDEILPSPHRARNNAFESESSYSSSDQHDTAAGSSNTGGGGVCSKRSSVSSSVRRNRHRRDAKCPQCSSTEDAITCEPLPKLHVCYVTPDSQSKQCFNLETLRQIALKSSKLQLRVDIDGERQNFLQPPAFRTAMSDDLVDQIASKFGRGALDLHGQYYKNRQSNYKNSGGDGADTSDYDNYDSNSSRDENIYDSFTAFRDRVKDYFKKGMGSQDIYVCPLCYGQIHRTIVNPPDTKKKGDDDDDDNDNDNDKDDVSETDERWNDEKKNGGNGRDDRTINTPSNSIYDPVTVLGYLDNDEMCVASQFCFKKLADVKKHLREVHNADTTGIQGNELYKRFLVRAPDGLLQRWLSTQVSSWRGQVKHGHMLMYWNQGNNQIFIHLLDLMERVKVLSEGRVRQLGDSSEDDDDDERREFNEYANKAREFYDSFAAKALQQWELISSPFLKSNANMKDFIALDDDDDEHIEEEGQRQQQLDDENPHAFLHQQLMQSMKEDSDENDLVHKLQRKYAAELSDEYESDSTEEELELVGRKSEKDGNDDDVDGGVYNQNGYYSPIEEEQDEWMLKLQNQRKRKASPHAKGESTKRKPRGTSAKNGKIETPVGKRIIRRKTTPTSATTTDTTAANKSSSCAPKKRALTIHESSSEDDDF